MKNNKNINLISLLKKVELRANYLSKHYYKKYIHADLNNIIIENIISNGTCHIVAIFKNYLIEDDNSEYIHSFYKYRDAVIRLKKLFYYHIKTSVIFPNYFPLIESKYLYNNVIKKQRIIDEQQDLDEKRKNEKLNDNNEIKDILFTSTIYDDIFNSSESVMRIVFGLDKNDYNLKKNINYKKINNSENFKLSDINEDDLTNNKDYSELNALIKELDYAEENLDNINKSKNLDEYILKNNNNAIKSKLKIVLKNTNMNKINKTNYDLLNNIINNSTNNITNSSNNIKTIKNINKKKYVDNIVLTNPNVNIDKNFINMIKKSKDKKDLNKIKNYSSKKNIPTPYRTLYGFNFIIKNPLINNLINNNSNIYNNNNINKNIKNINSGNNLNFNFFKDLFHKPSQFKNISKFNSSFKYNKSIKNINEIPKIDMSKLDTINNNNLLTITNRRGSRNHIEIFQKENFTINKTNKNKNTFRDVINPTLTLSILNKKEKNIFKKVGGKKFLYNNNNKHIKSMSHNKNNKNYFSKKILNSLGNKIIINQYNSKKDINFNKIFKKENRINKKFKTIENS